MKKIGVLIIVFFLMQVVSAGILLDPQTYNLTTKLNEPKSFFLTLTNNFNFSIQDIKFSDLQGFSFGSIGTLQQNQAKQISVTLTPNYTYDGTIDSKVSFIYLVEAPPDPQTYEINISEDGFEPSEITIRESDTIIWRNKGVISHSVTSSEFTQLITTGQTWQKTFTEVKIIDYWDEILYFGGTIHIINKTEKIPVHNPLYDTIFKVNLKITMNPTTLLMTLFDNNLTLDESSEYESLIKIENTGNEQARNIVLSSNPGWTSFQKNMFSLGKGESTYVNFKIAPIIYNTNETNKNYTLNINAQAENTDKYTQNISLFIPYKEVNRDVFRNTTNWLTFCREFPNSTFCNEPVIITKYINQTIYKDLPININVSKLTFKEILTLLQLLREKSDRTENDFKIWTDQYQLSIPQILNMTNSTMSRIERILEREKLTSILFWIFIPTGVIIAGTIFIFKWLRKRRKSVDIASSYGLT